MEKSLNLFGPNGWESCVTEKSYDCGVLSWQFINKLWLNEFLIAACSYKWIISSGSYFYLYALFTLPSIYLFFLCVCTSLKLDWVIYLSGFIKNMHTCKICAYITCVSLCISNNCSSMTCWLEAYYSTQYGNVIGLIRLYIRSDQ